jgi:hypothetical protein
MYVCMYIYIIYIYICMHVCMYIYMYIIYMCLCVCVCVCVCRFVYHGGPFLALPDQIAYPATGQGPGFCGGLMKMLYGHSILVRLSGIQDIIVWSLTKPKREALPTLSDDAAEHAKKS